VTDTDTDLDRNGAVVSEEKIADCVDGVSAPTIAVDLLREKHKKKHRKCFLNYTATISTSNYTNLAKSRCITTDSPEVTRKPKIKKIRVCNIIIERGCT